eukprot:UN05810
MSNAAVQGAGYTGWMGAGGGGGAGVAGGVLPAGAGQGARAIARADRRGPAGDVQKAPGQGLRRRLLGRVRARGTHHRLPQGQGRRRRSAGGGRFRRLIVSNY